MPRKHSYQNHQPYNYSSSNHGKTRYDSQQAAQNAAERAMNERGGDLELSVYRDIDGGWYLTSKPNKPHRRPKDF